MCPALQAGPEWPVLGLTRGFCFAGFEVRDRAWDAGVDEEGT